MTYRFAGFLSPSRVVCPAVLPSGAAWREISTPFEGSGVRLPEFVGKTPEVGIIRALATTLGFASSERWLYLTYDCWGGQIDYVYGFGCSFGEPFGPREEDARSEVEAAFTSLMGKLGLSTGQALRFTPFERGFWGET